MLLTVFEKYIFLQSLGWGIANSLWQAALLFLIYKFITVTSNRLSALSRYHVSLLLFFASFSWFVSTVIQNYIAIKNAGTQTAAAGWLTISENFTQSMQWLSVAYFIVLGLHLMLFVKKLNRLFLFKNSGFIKAPVDIRIFTEQTAFHIGIQKKVSIWLSEKAAVPSVIGFLKPIILLPVSALSNLNTAQAEAVILHELAHIRRNDYIINLVQSCIEMLLFFNPFVKMLGNTARQERENCCDDWVLNYRYNRHDYATALLILEQNRFAAVQFALTATNGKKNLLHRVKRLFVAEPSVHYSFSQKLKLVSVSMTVLITVLFVLPVAIKKTPSQITRIPQNALPASSNSIVATKANLPQIIIVDEKSVLAKVDVITKKQVLRKRSAPVATEAPVETEYSTALINEELLSQNDEVQLQEMAIQAANRETELQNKVYVKIEEEQSGLKEKSTWYVELNNNNGVAEIKPLIGLKKGIKEAPSKTKKKPVSGKKINTKKRSTT